ncbi:MAG: glycosyltransferase [Candidatus Roizmanbacteria bacterium]
MISVIIPVYKQKDIFLANLATNLRFLVDQEIIIVNDDPETKIREEVVSLLTQRGWSPSQFQLIEHAENQGFARSVNAGVSRATSDYLLLLNTDVSLYDQRWENAVRYLDANPHTFAVGFAQRERNGALVGRNAIYFKSGLFHHKAISFEAGSGIVPTAWAEGGSSIFRKSMWNLLHGFDPAYTPFYWEDVDLGYRAQLRGWPSMFDPSICVEHHHGGTTTAHFHSDQINVIAYRHQVYFSEKFAKGAQKVALHLHKLKRFIRR